MASASYSIGENVVKIVKGDIQKVENIFKDAQTIMEYANKCAKDC